MLQNVYPESNTMKTTARLSLTALMLALHFAPAHAQELRSTLSDQRAVAVTIYNDDLALVKDQRRVQLPAGASTLAFRDVSARLRPETALLRSITAPTGLTVWEQNFDFDLLTPQKLLEKSVGQTVQVVRTHPTTGQDTAEPAVVLATLEGVVLKMGQRIETASPGRIVFGDVPANLRDRPTLVMSLDNSTAAAQDLELSYLTGGLGWKADYVVELAAKEDKLDVSGWVTLTNTSGATYRNAKIQLVAGDVNQVPPELAGRTRNLAMASPTMVMEKRAVAEESLFEYHLYTLARPTTVAENQTKQVALMSATAVPARKELLLRGSDYYYQSSQGILGQKIKVAAFLEFDNTEASRLGMPLPKGVVRVYKKDTAGNAQFIGEDRIDHTPKNETVRLKLGDAFDVTADKKQTDFKKLGGTGKYNYVLESAYEIVLKNAKKEPVVVVVQEPMPGDWQILSTSHPATKGSSTTSVWKIAVPAQSSTTLTYRALVKF